MKYSINPFKWLAWLWRYAKCRKKGWRTYWASKPLSKKGDAALRREITDACENTVFVRPDIKRMVEAHNRRREARRKVFPHFEKVSDRLEDYYEESEE